MNKDDVYKAIDEIKQSDNWICKVIGNYMEANIDEFMECYEDYDDDE